MRSAVQQWLNPAPEELPDDFEMPIWDHLDELRERVLVGGLAAGAAVLTCFLFAKDLVVFLEAPVAAQVRCWCQWREWQAGRRGARGHG